MGGRTLKILAPLLAAVAVAVVPLLVSDAYLLEIFTFAGINALVVVGLAMLFGQAGQVSLGHAGLFGVGAYTAGVLVMKFAAPLWIAWNVPRRYSGIKKLTATAMAPTGKSLGSVS